MEFLGGCRDFSVSFSFERIELLLGENWGYFWMYLFYAPTQNGGLQMHVPCSVQIFLSQTSLFSVEGSLADKMPVMGDAIHIVTAGSVVLG